jgi:hypothetical protein
MTAGAGGKISHPPSPILALCFRNQFYSADGIVAGAVFIASSNQSSRPREIRANASTGIVSRPQFVPKVGGRRTA